MLGRHFLCKFRSGTTSLHQWLDAPSNENVVKLNLESAAEATTGHRTQPKPRFSDNDGEVDHLRDRG